MYIDGTIYDLVNTTVRDLEIRAAKCVDLGDPESAIQLFAMVRDLAGVLQHVPWMNPIYECNFRDTVRNTDQVIDHINKGIERAKTAPGSRS